MSQLATERVLHVHHWNDTLFSFRTTRDPGLRFRNGHFVMLGLPVDGKPLMRAYSVASAEPRRAPRVLQHQGAERAADLAPAAPAAGRRGDRRAQAGRQPGARRPAARPAPVPAVHRHRPGAFHQHHPGPRDLRALREGGADPRRAPGQRAGLCAASSSTSCRTTSTSARWCATSWSTTPPSRASRSATRAGSPSSSNRAGCSATSACRRSTPRIDRAMICGSAAMLADSCKLLDARGFHISPRQGELGDYVIERAFVEK